MVFVHFGTVVFFFLGLNTVDSFSVWFKNLCLRRCYLGQVKKIE